MGDVIHVDMATMRTMNLLRGSLSWYKNKKDDKYATASRKERRIYDALMEDVIGSKTEAA